MKLSYGTAFAPPAPVVPIRVRAPSEPDEIVLEGKLDTGADLSALPEAVIADLDLPPVRSVRVAAFLEAPREILVYRADLVVDAVVHESVEVVPTKRPYAIVGRNVLNRWVVHLDGPAARLTMRRAGRSAR